MAAVIADIRENFIVATGRRNDDVEVLVIDDGSTDRTADMARAAGARVFSHPRNLGYGASIKTGLRLASHETIMLTDADGTYPAEHFDSLLQELQQCDMAVGARQGPRVHYPWIRKPAKWLLVKVAVFLAERPIPDLNSGMRAFRRADALRFLNLYPSGFSFTTTITLAYMCSDLLIRYVPINYNPRTGRSKFRPFQDTKNLLLTIVRSVFFFNPLRVCIPLAVVFAVLALYVLCGPRDTKGNIFDGTVEVLAICALQILIVGFLADIIARSRR